MLRCNAIIRDHFGVSHQLQVSPPDHPVVDLGGMTATGVGGQVSGRGTLMTVKSSFIGYISIFLFAHAVTFTKAVFETDSNR